MGMARYFTTAARDTGAVLGIERAGDDGSVERERERDRVERERCQRARLAVLAGVRAAGGHGWDDAETERLYDVDRAAKLLSGAVGLVDDATFWLTLFACLRVVDDAPMPRGWRRHSLTPLQRARLEEVGRLGAPDVLLDALAADLARPPARDAEADDGALPAGRPLRACEVGNALAAGLGGAVVRGGTPGSAEVTTGAGARVLIADSDDADHPHGIGLSVQDTAGGVLAIGAWLHGITRAGCADVVAWVARVIRAWRAGVSVDGSELAVCDDDGPPGGGAGGAGGAEDGSMASGPARCDTVPAGALGGGANLPC